MHACSSAWPTSSTPTKQDMTHEAAVISKRLDVVTGHSSESESSRLSGSWQWMQSVNLNKDSNCASFLRLLIFCLHAFSCYNKLYVVQPYLRPGPYNGKKKKPLHQAG